MAPQLALPEEETARKAEAIKTLSLSLLVVTGAAGVISAVMGLFIGGYPVVFLTLTIVAGLFISAVTYVLSRMGKIWFAGRFLVVGMMLISSIIVYSLGGAAGPLAIIYTLPILIAALVVSLRAVFLAATVASILYLATFGIEVAGFIPQIMDGEWREIAQGSSHELVLAYIGLATRVVFFYLIAFLSWFVTRRLFQALQSSRRYATGLQTANEKLRASEEELRAANEELRATEEELRASNEELEAANEELTGAQEQLIRSEKLAAIGQLAGGVGHELRNPLGAIKNAVYYVRRKVAKSELARKEPRVLEFINIMDEEISSSNKIITDLLGFSRVGKPSVLPTRIEKIIEDALSRVTIPENIELIEKLDSDLTEVEVDPDQIQQVLVNMMTNAIQAMTEGGKLTVGARQNAKFLDIEITDTGAGIPQESVDKIFEPLFTTRAKGIGLGLAVSKSIIDRHGGHVEVKSKVGKGTTFNIKLPLKAV